MAIAADDRAFLSRLRGRFVVFDGPDGSGKTTQFHRFCHLASDAGLPVVEVREPGGTAIGEQVRRILLDPANEDMDLRCEMLLYMASRAQLVSQKIAPALETGQLVVADRFISSTLAYQGAAGGLDLAAIEAVAAVAVGRCMPDLVLVFDVDQATAAGRLSPLLDRIEQRGADFHARVRQGYLDQAGRHPDRYRVIDATADADTVFSRLLAAVRDWVGAA
jgi:dTMP kinase